MASVSGKTPCRDAAARCGTAVTTEQSSIFFTLPTELRLEVYQALLVDCLKNGNVADIAGLFFCCRQVYQEIESEFMEAVKPLLVAKKEWEVSEFCDGQLSMQILPMLNSKDAELSVIVPVRPALIRDNSVCFNHMMSPKTDILATAVSSLEKVFARDWSILTVNLDNGSRRPMTMGQINKIYSDFFSCNVPGVVNSFYHVMHIDRLVFCYDDPTMRLARSALYYTSPFTLVNCSLRSDGATSAIRRGWLTTEGKPSGWRLTINLKDGLDPVKRAICCLTLTEGDLRLGVEHDPFGDVPIDVLDDCCYV